MGLKLKDSFKLAFFVAGETLGTFFLIDFGNLLLIPGDGV